MIERKLGGNADERVGYQPLTVGGLATKVQPETDPHPHLQIQPNPPTSVIQWWCCAVAMEGAAEKWKRTALLVIDMQKDFIVPNGLVRVNGGEAIVPSVIKAVDVARQHGILVVWVVREHDALGRDVELFRRHMYGDEKTGPTVKGSEGAELVDGLVIEEGDYKLVKTRFSAFFSTHLHSFLQGAGINRLVVVGVQTPNCIRQTVFDAVAFDYESVMVIYDATAAATPQVHDANISDMENIGVKVPTLKEWLNYLKLD